METKMTHVHNAHAHHSFGHAVLAAMAVPFVWLHRHHERQELANVLEFPEYLLKDIGLKRSDVVREAVKPFWRS